MSCPCGSMFACVLVLQKCWPELCSLPFAPAGLYLSFLDDALQPSLPKTICALEFESQDHKLQQGPPHQCLQGQATSEAWPREACDQEGEQADRQSGLQWKQSSQRNTDGDLVVARVKRCSLYIDARPPRQNGTHTHIAEDLHAGIWPENVELAPGLQSLLGMEAGCLLHG